MKCPYCGSEKIEIGVAWGKSSEMGNVGLKFNTGGFFATFAVANAYSDLCLDCKTIVRSYIKESTNKNWSHESGDLGYK